MRLILSVVVIVSITCLGGAARAELSSTASAERRPFLGVLLDVGAPEGAAASIAVRPWHWIRFHGGAMYNTVSTGVQGGVSLIPFYSWFTPALTFEAGRFFPGDANTMARRISGNATLNNPLLRHVGYDFGSAHLGLEIGSPRSMSFFLRGGLSYVQSTISGLQEQIGGNVEASDLKLRGVIPSAKLGLILYFL
jgi:hypothetical protein